MKILITGGTGSLGRGLIARWEEKHQLTILSRDPHKQQMVQAKHGLDPSFFILGDICDYETVKRACKGQEFLIHAAALKVVSQGEQNPIEYHRVNSIGSMVVARAWVEIHGHLNNALYINSDKAVAPINFYGATKRIGETFFVSQGFMSLRYGNVVESDGSFIHKWTQSIGGGEPIEVRLPHPTRFFMAMDDAINLIEGVMAYRQPGIYVPNSLKSFNIYDVAKALVRDVQICHKPLQPGEKQHEQLIMEGETVRDVSDILGEVEVGYTDNIHPFSSDMAPRMSGGQVLAALRLSALQQVFA